MLVFGSYWILLHLQAEAMSSESRPSLSRLVLLAAVEGGFSFWLLAINGAFFWRLRQRVLRVVGAAGEAAQRFIAIRENPFPAGA